MTTEDTVKQVAKKEKHAVTETTATDVIPVKTVKVKTVAVVGKTPTSYRLDFVSTASIKNAEDIINRKVSKAGVDELANDIELNGLLQPIIVLEREEEGAKSLYLLAGQRRLRAIKQIKKSNPTRFAELFAGGIPVHVVLGDRKQAIAVQLRENVHREDMNLQAILPFIKELKAEGMKNKDIAIAIGKSDAYISQVISIEKELGVEATEAVSSGEVDAGEAIKAASKVKKGQATKDDALAEAKAKTQAKADAGRDRAEKRKTAKAIWLAYSAIPAKRYTSSILKGVLEEALKYLAGESDSLPDELEI